MTWSDRHGTGQADASEPMSVRRDGSPAVNAVRPQSRRHPVLLFWSLWVTRTVTAAGLAIDAYVHLDLAPAYAEAGGALNESVLFRAEAVVALPAAAAVVITGRRGAYLVALAVGASALAVMVVARYVDVGPIGPFPSLYDPVWYPEKLLAAFAEATAIAAALGGATIVGMAGRSRPRAGSPRP